MRRGNALVVAVLVLFLSTACTLVSTPSPTSSGAPSSTPTAAATPTIAPTATASSSPSPSPEPTLSLPLPGVSDPRIVSADVSAEVGADGGTVTVTVSSTAADRIDELVLRWPAGLEETLRLAPFTPSEERIRDGGPPLRQEWTKWVVGPGERGEPAGTISVGWGPLLPGATLEIPLVATRIGPGPIAFDLQLLASNDLLSFEGGLPAEIRVEMP